MKAMKKFFALLLTMTMALAMGTTALAADNGSGSITITNATIGEDYRAYKLFDATVSGDKIAYTIKDTAEAYYLVSDPSSPFELTQIGTTHTYNVTVADSKSDADVLQWLNDKSVGFGKPDFESVATSSELTWDSVPYGYYFIATNLGATITVTNVRSNVEVHDKNQTPSWAKPENDPSAPFGKNIYDAVTGTYTNLNSASNGDVLDFEINAFIPKYNGDKIVNKYIFDDYTRGLRIDESSFEVYVNGRACAYDLDVRQDGENFVLTLPVYNNAMPIPDNATLTIKYKAEVISIIDHERINNVSMSWTEFDPDPTDPSEPANPNDPKDPNPSDLPADSMTTTHIYGFELQKYRDSVDDSNKLFGAEFKLYDFNDNEIKLMLDTNGNYVVADSKTDIGKIEETIQAGTAKIFGLKEGDYLLEEVKAPDGYNMLTSRVFVSVGERYDRGDGYNIDEISVINKSGVVLPETGGIGTTIFYVVGGLLMAGAVVLLITKKKMSANED